MCFKVYIKIHVCCSIILNIWCNTFFIYNYDFFIRKFRYNFKEICASEKLRTQGTYPRYPCDTPGPDYSYTAKNRFEVDMFASDGYGLTNFPLLVIWDSLLSILEKEGKAILKIIEEWTTSNKMQKSIDKTAWLSFGKTRILKCSPIFKIYNHNVNNVKCLKYLE